MLKAGSRGPPLGLGLDRAANIGGVVVPWPFIGNLDGRADARALGRLAVQVRDELVELAAQMSTTVWKLRAWRHHGAIMMPPSC